MEGKTRKNLSDMTSATDRRESVEGRSTRHGAALPAWNLLSPTHALCVFELLNLLILVSSFMKGFKNHAYPIALP